METTEQQIYGGYLSFMSNKDFHAKPLQPQHVAWIFYSSAVFTLLFFVSFVLSYLFSSTFKRISLPEKAEWVSRVVSNINAVFTFQGAFRALFIGPNPLSADPVGLVSDLSNFYQAAFVGYLIYDFILVLLFHKQMLSIGVFFHHFFGAIAYLVTLSFQCGQLWTIVFSITEATTPFVNQRWFFDKMNAKSGKAYMINGLLMWLGFLIFRVSLLPWILYNWFHYGAFQSYALGASIFTFAQLININVLNLYWFYKISLGIIKVLGSSKKSSKPAKSPKEGGAAALKKEQ